MRINSYKSKLGLTITLVFLMFSILPVFYLFLAVPLALIFLAGCYQYIFLILLIAGFCSFLPFTAAFGYSLFFIYAIICASLIGIGIKKRLKPNGLIYLGPIFFFIIIQCVIIYFYLKESEFPLKMDEFTKVFQEISNEARSKELVTVLFDNLPLFTYLSMSIYYWINVMAVIKFRRFFKIKYGYGVKNIFTLKVPMFFIYILILSLILLLIGDNFTEPGKWLLAFIIPFYFWRGLNISIYILKWLRIPLSLITLISIILIFIAWQLIALIGVVDYWFNFKHRLHKEAT